MNQSACWSTSFAESTMSGWRRWSIWLDYGHSASWHMQCFGPDFNTRGEAELTAALAQQINLEIEREVHEIYNKNKR